MVNENIIKNLKENWILTFVIFLASIFGIGCIIVGTFAFIINPFFIADKNVVKNKPDDKKPDDKKPDDKKPGDKKPGDKKPDDKPDDKKPEYNPNSQDQPVFFCDSNCKCVKSTKNAIPSGHTYYEDTTCMGSCASSVYCNKTTLHGIY